MSSILISTISLKGGVGKTTFISNFIERLCYENKFILSCDFDQNRSLSMWYNVFSEKNNYKNYINLPIKDFLSDVDKIKRIKNEKKYDFIICDIEGHVTKEKHYPLFVLSDFIVIPTIDGFDVFTFSTLIQILDIWNEEEKFSKKILCLLSAFNTQREKNGKDNIQKTIQGKKNIICLRSSMHQRMGYRDALACGSGSISYGCKKIKENFYSIYNEIMSEINEK